jgi:hypothetical protein
VLVPLPPWATVTLVGAVVRLKSGVETGFTVRLIAVELVSAPDVPLTVTFTVPVAAPALAVSVNVLELDVGFGLKLAVTPLGKPDAERVTLPVKPFVGVMLIVLVPLLPCVIVRLLGEGDRLKLGVPEQPLKANDAMLVAQSKVPVTF